MAQSNESPSYVNIKFPSAFVHPYRFTDKNGKDWDKAIVNLPPNTRMGGIDLTGYSFDRILNSHQMSQIANGENVTFGLKEDERVTVFKGSGQERAELQLDPWKLTKAVKAQREEYIAGKAAERESAGKEAPSLSDRASQAQETSGLGKTDGPDRDAPSVGEEGR